MLEYSAAFRIGKAGGLSELARTIPMIFGDLNQSPPNVTSGHCIEVSLLA